VSEGQGARIHQGVANVGVGSAQKEKAGSDLDQAAGAVEDVGELEPDAAGVERVTALQRDRPAKRVRAVVVEDGRSVFQNEHLVEHVRDLIKLEGGAVGDGERVARVAQRSCCLLDAQDTCSNLNVG